MEWNKNESNQATLYTGQTRGLPRVEAMTEMWRIVSDKILPENSGVDWDYIRVEFWTDSGRIIIFPASSRIEKRIERATCQVIFSDLLTEYEELADAEIDDDIFCEQLARIQSDWANDLENTAKASALSNIRILFWDSESEEPFNEVVLS